MELSLKNREWKAFKINDIFIVNTGALIPKNELKEGMIPRITATDNNNGIFDFYENNEHRNYRKITNFISVSFLGSVFYHPYMATLDMKIHAIQIPNLNLNRHLAHFIVFCLKQMAFNYSYGNQLSSSDLPKKKILLPVNNKSEPDYTFMESYMRAKETKALVRYKEQALVKIQELKLNKEKLRDDIQWKEFKMTDIFSEIQRGRRLRKADHKIGVRPYVSSTGINNGVDGFISNDEGVRIFSNCLTVANSGSVGSTFFHPYSFVASDHVTKLENKEFSKYVYLFIANLTSRFAEKYSFNREINDTRIRAERILLPVNDKNEPNYEYMEQYMKNLEAKKLERYYEYKLKRV